jgi:hypothetical protein
MMRNVLLGLKVLVVVAIFLLTGIDFLAQGRQSGKVEWTLSAAGAEAVKQGIRTYRIAKPRHDKATDSFFIEAELLDESQRAIGRWSERIGGSEDDPGAELELQIRMRSVKLVQRARMVTVYTDGEEIYTGPFATTSDPVVRQKLENARPLLTLLSAIGDEVKATRKEMSRVHSDWNSVSFVPAAARPVALSLVRWLPRSVVLHAAPIESGGCATPSYSSLSGWVCRSGFGGMRSLACSRAQDSAAYGCSNWICCIGCCDWLSVSCDCGCVADDLVCLCYACGAPCARCND